MTIITIIAAGIFIWAGIIGAINATEDRNASKTFTAITEMLLSGVFCVIAAFLLKY